MITILITTTLIISLFFPSKKRKENKTEVEKTNRVENGKKVLNKAVAST